ncbi:hypothetical protein JMJ35_001430 [Cladonia borealis]|uniref:Uncharacterized protein n=1 Tax=Cladonia borealis TaxID=184061 RepID=A0AA39R8F6_9LECA|nr:hypothetical protein JMJ35_001430 [Cladonia borealis]
MLQDRGMGRLRPNASLASASTSEYTTVTNGFTLTSPSVYVAYMNIGATSSCPDYTTTGRLYNVTRGYDPASLFTDPCGYGYGNWKTINYSNLQYPAAPAAARANNYGCTVPPVGEENGYIGYYHGMVPWGTGNPAATPLFSVPDDVTLVNTSWQTCSVTSYGVWDPPMILTKETAMVPAAPTLTQQLIATPRSPISTPYGPPTVVPSVEDPKTDAPQLLPPIPSGNADPNSPTGYSFSSSSNPTSDASQLLPQMPPENSDPNPPAGDSPFSSSGPTDNAPPSENASNDDSASDATSATLPSTQIYQPAQRITGSASSSIASPIVKIQSPAPSPSPGLRLPAQPAFKDAKFALSPVAPIVLPQTNTAGGQMMPADPDFISLPATTSISGQGGIDIASAAVELDISSQSVIDAPTIGSTTIPLSAVSSGIFTVGGQVVTAESNAIFMEGVSITPAGPGRTIGGTRVSLGSSGLLVVGSSSILLSAEQASPTVFTVGEQVVTAESNAVFMKGVSITPAGPGRTIGGTRVSLGSSGLLVVGSSSILLSAEQASPTVFTVGGQVVTAESNAVFMKGVSIEPAGPGTTIGGIRVSLGSLGLLEVGSSKILLSAEQALPTVFTVGSEVFTPNPTAISMNGRTITAGGPGVTIAGTTVSLGSSGLLEVGSSTITLSAEQALPTVFTVGGEVFTPNPTAIAMDGTTITAGGPGATIAGTPVDLQASGSLVIGNSTFAVIPTNVSTSPADPILEGQATNRGRKLAIL